MLSSIVALSYRTGSLWSFPLFLDSHQATWTVLTGKLGFCKVSELTLSVPCAAQQHSVFPHCVSSLTQQKCQLLHSSATPPPWFHICFIPDCGALGCCQGTPGPSSSWLLQECRRSRLQDQASLSALNQHTASSEKQRKVGLQPRVPCSPVRVSNHRSQQKLANHQEIRK